jgi:lipopolysaccharide/colanic/teichoic acid biosynthesis glycosyltransferase
MRRSLKATIDYLFAIPALLLLTPLFLGIAMAIKIESPGPVLFRQRALGFRGREFSIFRFRTMYTDSEVRLMKNRRQWVGLMRHEPSVIDPRVTRIGRLLRRTGLDMLPSLFNVLLRDMSLVGPYTLTRRDILRYGRRRVDVLTTMLPGITGLWQLRAANTAASERLRLELAYVDNWSPILDLQILMSTFASAYRPRLA